MIYEPAVTSSFLWADGLVSEGEFLDITEIKRQQAEDYECITNNGVAPPDQRKVKVTVNCKYPSKSPAASHFKSAADLRRCSRMMYCLYTCRSFFPRITMHEFMNLNSVSS